ncbi:MAG: hypothetical protein WBD28_01070 [Candidatus Zixiibacteriota bacterium]
MKISKLLTVILLVWVSLVQAEELKKDQESSSPFIEKGSSFRTTFVEYFNSEDPNRDINIINLNFERGYYVLKPLSLSGGIHLMLTDGHRIDHGDSDRKLNADRLGAGLAGTVRFDVVRKDRHNLFIAFRLGFLLCSDRFPPGGTFWNFTQRYVFGVSVRFLTNVNLLLGVNRLHISNAGYKRNPSYNGNGAFAGVVYGF